ncbi:MAG: Amidase enhancer precursor [Candidatus Aerophobetes bacterium ADurb.Bin490]|nr:MAG: Amidase enhancer precursor [Candidatus Aerophobetes bacterium ADurb.Bin490]
MSAEDLTPGGNVRMLLIKDKKNTVEFPLEKFISAYGKKYRWSDMPSRKFTVLKKGTSFILKGRGAGHGCGLCLAGAHMLALKGWSYEGVLNFYYPGMQLIKAPE